MYAQKWSTDVKVEGKGVVRFGDIATSNHACNPADSPPMVIVGKPALPPNPDGTDCIVGEYSKEQKKCSKQTNKKGEPYQFHHIIPDRTFRCGRRKVRGLKNPRNIRQKIGPSHGKGICICLPPENHVGSKKSAPGTTAVHQELDDKLTSLGQASSTASSPSGCAPLKKVRGQCFAALAKLVPNTISKECYKHAVEEVMKKTDSMKDKQVRAEKSIKNLSTKARGVLGAQ